MGSPEAIEITVSPPEGGEPLRLAWDRGMAESLATGDRGGQPGSPWRGEDEVDWERVEALRLVSAAFQDREGQVEARGDGVRREVARMAFRLAGTSGAGLYEVLRPR